MTGFLLISLALALVFLACMEIGRCIRLCSKAEDPKAGLGAIEAATFGLLALLLGFTFSGADSLFEARRELIVSEASAIGTAYLRVDLLPADVQAQVRQDLRRYTDMRIAFYDDLDLDPEKAQRDLAESEVLQQKIWKEAVPAALSTGSAAVVTLVTTSLNDIIDVTGLRSAARLTHSPLQIYLLLGTLAIAASLLAGYAMGEQKKRPWLHTLLYAIALTITLYTILDLEFPRSGLIRVNRYDAVLVTQRKSMN
jgi:hypothetical protein